MEIAVCGLDCAVCEARSAQCGGCAAQKGNVFWAAASGLAACPMYACAKGRGHAHCGLCAEAPCALWHTTREPGIPDEVFDASLHQRLANLRGLVQP